MLSGALLVVCAVFCIAALIVFVKREQFKKTAPKNAKKKKQNNSRSRAPQQSYKVRQYFIIGVVLWVIGIGAGVGSVVANVVNVPTSQAYTYDSVEFKLPEGWYKNAEDATGAYFKNDSASSGTTKVQVSDTPYTGEVQADSKSALADAVTQQIKARYPEQEGRTLEVATDYYDGAEVTIVSATLTAGDRVDNLACFIANGKLYTIDYAHDASETVSQPLTTMMSNIHLV